MSGTGVSKRIQNSTFYSPRNNERKWNSVLQKTMLTSDDFKLNDTMRTAENS